MAKFVGELEAATEAESALRAEIASLSKAKSTLAVTLKETEAAVSLANGKAEERTNSLRLEVAAAEARAEAAGAEAVDREVRGDLMQHKTRIRGLFLVCLRARGLP